ncbi:hypothetical protein HIM_02403 [Hirsutella minnesotensis 3608]|nr:hypothetical protein HIM_02403 [Hirsutella minnesotensis 3608]
MKSALLFALAGSLVAAQSQLQGIPPCARECVSKSISGPNVAGCAVADIACVCRNKDFLNNIACCLAGVCKQEEQEQTVKFATQLCGASQVQVPSKVECKKGAAATGSSASAGSSMSSPTPTSSSPTSSNTADDSDSSDTASSTSARNTAGSNSATTSTSSASASPSSTGAAANVVGGMGGVAGALLAMLAVL